MKKKRTSISLWHFAAAVVLLASAGAWGSSCAQADEAEARAELEFGRRVLPLFKEKCFACHGDDPEDVRGELNMRSREGLLRGGQSGEASLVVGRPAESPLYLAVRRDHDVWPAMPPKENDGLTAEQVERIAAWISSGAVWPSEARLRQLEAEHTRSPDEGQGVILNMPGGLSSDWSRRRYEPENLWAYQPLDRALAQRSVAPGPNPIDEFINRRAAEQGLALAPLADRHALVRRATFDLWGLPPTPEEVEAFVRDPADDASAFANLVDRLLESPQYGQQWGRHWLDVVRYADSSGYANDYERGNAWRYRDYVVRSFNEDKPYDQFIREQIAGDELVELADGQQQELPPDRRSEWLVAAGFLRMGAWELTGMEVPRIARQRFLDDVTDAVGQVFLGQMLQCARCHDHKFDPLPTRDYYSIQAAFATTQLAEREAPFMAVENTSGFAEEDADVRRRREYYQAIMVELDRKATAAARQWYADRGLDPARFEAALQATDQPDRGFSQARAALLRENVPEDQLPPRHVGFEPQDYGLERVAQKGLQRLGWRSERTQPLALSVYSGLTPELHTVNAPLRVPAQRMSVGRLEQVHILAGGDPFSPTDAVAPGVLSVVRAVAASSADDASLDGGDAAPDPDRDPNPDPDPVAPAPTLPADDALVGRRLALADWIASPANPLTPRVMVNRLWQWHFGRALAGNANNFGATGKKPSHPELLDWLALTFVERGWSVKAMHRLIMNSEAYRRSSQHPAPTQLAAADPQGTSYAAFLPRRLDAEELRDAMLAISGELNPELGGLPVRPEMNLEAALQPRMVMGTFAEAWQPSRLPAQRHRRSIYTLRIRGQRDPFLEVFNAPSPDLSCEAREASTVTPQVFAMFNSEISYDRALAMAQRLANLRLDSRATIDRAMQLAFNRPARPDEIDACLKHWQRMTERHATLTFAHATYPREVLREAVEENTGETFTFREPLEVYADFVPDLKPADVGPEVRGLAEVCLVLMNANEFAYVY